MFSGVMHNGTHLGLARGMQRRLSLRQRMRVLGEGGRPAAGEIPRVPDVLLKG